MEKFRNRDAKMTLDMGLRESLTFYDASYIKLALESNLELVTDDEKLYRIAGRYIKTFKSGEL